MRMRTVVRLNWLLLAAVSLTMVVWGCAQAPSSSDAEQEREPFYLRAKKLSEQNDFQGAAAFYAKALMVNPQSAPAHLEWGLLCDEKLGDPIGAIYHYRQYLALRPNSDKKQLVQDFIERAQLSLAAMLPQSSPVDPNEVARLRSENAGLVQENLVLKSKVAELEKAMANRPSEGQGDSAPVAVAAVATRVADAATGGSAATMAASQSRTHIVAKGDTLQSLALRYYGTRLAWEKIYQANRSALLSKDQLKVGQILVLPQEH